MQYRKEIDGLRALAVLAVIANHLNKDLLPSGFLGVDIFFVISGYVITASFSGRKPVTPVRLLTDFYARRVKRLMPALLVYVVSISVLISLFTPSPQAHLLTGIAALFGVSNFYLIRKASSYFGDLAQLNPFTHTWSLGVEEQFYLFFPALVLLTAFGTSRPKSDTRFYGTLALLSLASLALFAWLGVAKPHVAYYFMPARFWELACGAFAFWIAHQARFAMHESTLRWLSPMLLVATVGTLFSPAHFMIEATVVCVALTVGLIVSARPGTWTYMVLSSRPAVYVGLISYSLYLWHWGVLSISRWTVGVDSWIAAPLLVAMFALAAASYHWIERPLRRASWSLRSPVTVAIGFGGAASAAAFALALAFPPVVGRLYTGTQPDTAALGIGTLVDPYGPSASMGKWQGKACLIESHEDVGKILSPSNCTLGDFDAASTRALVVGNSFAASFVQAFDALVMEDGFAVTLVSAWGVSPTKELPTDTKWTLSHRYYWDTVVPGLVSQLRPGDWVFLVNDLAGYSPQAANSHSELLLETLTRGIESFATELRMRGVRLAVMHTNPYIREANCEPAMSMRQWFAPYGGPCKFISKRDTLERRAGLDRRLRTLERQGAIVLVDLIDVFCPTETCHFHGVDETLLYRDVFSHPSVEAARLSAPIIRKKLTGT